MKLAEVLILRSDIQTRMEQIRNRLSSNIKIQEGDTPTEDPKDILKEYDRLLKEYEELVIKINKTNNETIFEKEKTLADVLVERDVLLKKRNMYYYIYEEGSIRQDRYSNQELKYISVVDIKSIQKEIDNLSKIYRELDTKIQGFNWTIDLI